MSSHKYDYLLKIIIIGDSSAGKLDFLLRFIDYSISDKHLTTVGTDFKIKIINYENKIIKLQIWDTAGEERFRTISKTYYNGAHGIIIMYDVTNRNSFESVRNWMKQINVNADKSTKKVLVGHKCDEPGKVVTEEEGKKMAEEYNIGFFESSARTNINVSEVFYYLVKEIFIEKGIIKDESAIKLSNINSKDKKKQCAK